MFCTSCGKQTKSTDKFCGNCGNDLSNNASPSKQDLDLSQEYKSSVSQNDVLKLSRTVAQEYQGKKHLEKPLKTFLNTGFAKERISEAWSQKALVRLEGSAKVSSILPREICFAEETVLFIVANSMLSKGTATALRKAEVQYIEINEFEAEYKVGVGQSTHRYWRLNFVTNWAGIHSNAPKGMMMATSDPTWYFNNGEVSFYLPLGNTSLEQEQYEQMYGEKMEIISTFYPVRISDVVLTQRKSIGLFFGSGFWREIGD